jgi:hypothetical protein
MEGAWAAHETPVRAGTSTSGIFSPTFHDGDHGAVVGSDYEEDEAADGPSDCKPNRTNQDAFYLLHGDAPLIVFCLVPGLASLRA